MKPILKGLLFVLFLVSGFCGLLYQTVWIRIAYSSFGVITPVLSLVLSVFMGGLFLGSWGAGKSVDSLSRKLRVSAIYFYALAELVIAAGSYAVPKLFSLGETVLLLSGESNSVGYLFRSAVILSFALLPWCIAMGATFPFMMAFVKERDPAQSSSFSFLYLANVIGAMLGVLVTAVVLIEILGFHRTLGVAAVLNILVGVLAAGIGLVYSVPFRHVPAKAEAKANARAKAPARDTAGERANLMTWVLFTTGFVSMAMEVVWTRAFIVVLETQVYSFALLLFMYLLATWLGSLFYRRHLKRDRVLSTRDLLGAISVAALLPLFNDPRLSLGSNGAILTVFPFCLLLGYLTPKLIDRSSLGKPEQAGFAYAINVLGCILGPLVASYLLLPAFGLKYSLILLALPFLPLFLMHPPRVSSSKGLAYLIPAGVLALLAITVGRTYEDQWKDYRRWRGQVRRDHTATVISYGEGMKKRLLVNGIGITHLTTITKVMAHLPLAFVEDKPSSALVICFGMGTTFRSLASWGIDTTAAELVPSVKKAFGYYFDDAADILAKPNARVVIDDGRRFLKRTQQLFDVITLDPPPPVEAAASSLLYSEEFYALVKTRLKPKGILQQWIPQPDDATLAAATHSLVRSFPFVRMFRSHEGWGHHFLASSSPIPNFTAEQLVARMPANAQGDLVEWEKANGTSSLALFQKILGNEVNLSSIDWGNYYRITDDRPFNEYFMLRRSHFWGPLTTRLAAKSR